MAGKRKEALTTEGYGNHTPELENSYISETPSATLVIADV